MGRLLKLVMMVTTVKRANSEKLISFFNTNNVPMTLGRYGRGTATDVMLDYLGVAEKEKCISFSLMDLALAQNVSQNLKKQLPDAYSFVIPISTVGGKSTMEMFNENFKEIKENEKTSYKFNKELILIITNRGYVDDVMEVAREAGAPGGTVIHARGTGVGDSEKFFGVTVGAEKEMIFIVTERETRDKIMQAVMSKAGMNSKAQSILFSLPVTSFIA